MSSVFDQAAEVSGRSTLVKLEQQNLNKDGTIQRPTIVKESEELQRKTGKKSMRTITGTYWLESTEVEKAKVERDTEFERVKNVWMSSKYILYGTPELTEENKKPHCHFIIAFATSKMWSTIIKTLSSKKYHIEPCRNFTNAVEYAKKENPEDYKEYGTPLKQGLRTDLKKTLEDNNYDEKKIMENNPELYVKYRNGIKDICENKQTNNNLAKWLGLEKNEKNEWKKSTYEKPKIHWYFGKTGTGKSLEVKNIICEKILKNEVEIDTISKIDTFENGFAIGEIKNKTDILIIDEFRGSMMSFNQLLKILDGTNINVKGGKIFVKAKEIYITSCYNPVQCYPNLGKTDSINQLYRRLTTLKEFVNIDERIEHDILWEYEYTYDEFD